MNRRTLLASLSALAVSWLGPRLALARPEVIPSPAPVRDLGSMLQWISSWACGQYGSRCAVQETKSGRKVEHIELAWGAAFSLDELDVARFTYGEYGILSDETKGYIRSSAAYKQAISSLYGYAARSVYGHAMAASGADVYWRIKPEDDIALQYEMTEISLDGPDYDFMTDQRGKKVLTHGLIKFYCRFSFDTERYTVIGDPYGWHQIDLNQTPVQWWDAAKPEGAPIQIIMRS